MPTINQPGSAPDPYANNTASGRSVRTTRNSSTTPSGESVYVAGAQGLNGLVDLPPGTFEGAQVYLQLDQQINTSRYVDDQRVITNFPAGANGAVQYRLGEDFGGTSDIQVNLITGRVTDITAGNISGNVIISSNYQGNISDFTNDSEYVSLNAFSVTTRTASGNGALSYNNLTGVFSFTPADASYGNTNVAAYLPTYTGAVGAGTVTATGNISAARFLGNGSALTGMYGNANVESLLPTYAGDLGASNLDVTDDAVISGTLTAGNIMPQANAVYSLGSETQQWSELWVSDNTIYIGGVPIGIGAGNVLTVAGQPVLSNDSNSSVTTTGNVTAAYFLGNGSQLTGMYGDANVATYLSTAQGDISASDITAAGNISAGAFLGDGSQLTGMYGDANVEALLPTYTGDVTASNVSAQGTVSGQTGAFNDINLNNASVNRMLYVNSDRNIYDTDFAYDSATGAISGSGNISAGYILGNGSQLTGMYSNSDVAAYLPTYIGNIGAGNVTVSGNISAAYFLGDGSQLTGMPAPYANANVASYLPTYQGNIGAGNIAVSGEVTAAGNISATRFLGDGSQLTGLPEQYSNANVAAYLPTYSGNISAGNVTITGNVSADYILGNGSQLTGLPAQYGNANVAEYLPSYTGDIAVSRIIPTGTLTIDNSASGNTADINILSADNILLQGKDMPLGSGAEGGDIDIYAGDGSTDDGTGTSSSGGDIQIYGGHGGSGNVYDASSGGLVRLRGGQGGDASATAQAADGGNIEITAGDAGSNYGNIGAGAAGGAVVIQAGDSSGNLMPGGDIILTTGAGGPNAGSGQLEINVPPSDTGISQTWSFNSQGSLTLPDSGQIVLDGGDGSIGSVSDDLVITWDNEDLRVVSAQGSIELQADNAVRVQTNYDSANALYAGRWEFSNNDLVSISGDFGIVSEAGNITLSGGRDGVNSGNAKVRAVNLGTAVYDWTFGNDGVMTLPNGGEIDNDSNNIELRSTNNINLETFGVVNVYTDDGNHQWQFGDDGVLTAPSDITTPGNVSATYFLGNGSQLTGMYGNANVEALLLDYQGNIGAGNVNTANLLVSGDAVIQGNLRALGNTTFISSTDLVVGNINIVLANLAEQPSDANGAGIIVGNATGNTYATILWNSISNTWNISRNVQSDSAAFTAVTVSGNVSANLFLGDGSQLTGMYGNANVSQYLPTYTGNIGVNTLTATGNVTAAGNVSATYLIGDGSLLTNLPLGSYSNANVAAYLPTYQGNVSAGNVTVTGNITGDYVFGNGSQLTGLPEQYGNANVAEYLPTYVGNISAGNVNVTGNITGDYILGNGSQLTGMPAAYANANVASYLPTYEGNISAGNVNATGNVSANYILGNGSQLTGLPQQYGNANVAEYLPTYTGDITASNVTASGNITGDYILGNGSQLTGLPANYGNANVAEYLPTYTGDITASVITATGNITGDYILGNGSQLTGLPQQYGNANVAAYLPTYTGNVGAGNVDITGNVTAAYVLGNGSQLTGMYGDANVEALLPTYSGNIGNLTASDLEVTGNVVIQGNLRALGNTTFVSSTDLVVGNINVILANLAEQPSDANGAGIIVGNVTGNTYATMLWNSTSNTWVISQNIESDSATFNTMSVSGNISANYILGNGSQLTGMYGNATVADYLPTYTGNISAGNISVSGLTTLANTVSTGNVSAANLVSSYGIYGLDELRLGNTADPTATKTRIVAGGNISYIQTGVGAPGSTGNIVFAPYLDGVERVRIDTRSGNLTASGNIIANGNVSGSNISTTGAVTATGNITATGNLAAGNISTTGQATVTGNLASGNISTTGQATVTGNLAAGNISSTGQATVTGNITATGNLAAGNISTTGLLTTTGNITAGNISSTGQATVTGNITAGNISSTGQATVTGNITAGNISSTGQATITGNLAAGNITTAGRATVTGNLSAGNISTTGVTTVTGNITATGNLAAGNITTAGQVQATGNLAAGNISATGVATVTGNITTGNLSVNGRLGEIVVSNTANTGTAWLRLTNSGNHSYIQAGNGIASSTGNVSFSPYASDLQRVVINTGSGNITAQGNISASAAAFTGNVSAGNISSTGQATITGNITVGNVRSANGNMDISTSNYTWRFDNAGALRLPTVGGDEGGELTFGVPTTNTSLVDTVKVDIFQNRLRFFDGTAKGAYIDLAQAAAGVGTLLNNRVSGIVDNGVFVTMDNIRATVRLAGGRGLGLATVSGSISYNISGTYGAANATVGGASWEGQTLTTTVTDAIFGWNFVNSGDASTYVLNDRTNNRCYRITIQIGPGWNSNPVCIERLV